MSRPITLHFLKKGMLTQMQDLGRSGHQAFGVPVGGAMDRTAAQMANWLVGNPADSPVLEITLLGPTISFNLNCQIALTGADLSPQINGMPMPMHETLEVNPNTILSFGKIKSGCRAYLAVGGDWQVKKWLDSASPLLSDSSLIPDSVMEKGSALKIIARPFIEKRKLPTDFSTLKKQSPQVRVMKGPEFRLFSEEAVNTFFNTSFKITPSSNRMGYRLDTPIFDKQRKGEIISSGIIPGTIQITNAGHPIILLADAQTTGGYPRIVNVISADLDKLAQMKPGDEVQFVLVGMEEARRVMVEKNRRLFRFLQGAN